jgi:DNA-binding response OmpR family regulator
MKNKILVLDDDTLELRKLREILTREGFNIITATDMDTAIQLTKHIKFSFVLGKIETLGYSLSASEIKDPN